MDSLSDDLAEVKKAVVSIQASLLTSVRLLQGKHNSTPLYKSGPNLSVDFF